MTDSPSRPLLTTLLCGALHAIGGGLGWSLLPALLPDIATDLGISHTMGGLVWGAAALGIAVASPFGGAAVDRWGARRVAGIAMLVGAVACALRSVAPDAWMLTAAMFAFGLHIGFVAPSIPKALAGHVAPENFGNANGAALLCYTLGTALTVLIGRTVLAPALGGWRPTMVAAAVAMGLVGVLWLVLVRDRVALAGHAGIGDVLKLAKNGQMLRVAAMHFLLFGGYLALLGFLPRALAEGGLEPAAVGVAVASWLGVAGVSNYLGPWLSDRMGRRRPFIVIGSVATAAALGVLAFAPAASATWLLVLAAIGGGCFAPLLLALPLEIPEIGPARAGAALGLLMLVGQAGGFVLPLVAGGAAEGGGFAAALVALALAHVAVLLPVRGLRETGSAGREPAVAKARA